ncbi:MAG TPA: hypothetical protein VK447_19430 [Myxococcaceae bacterium]|nr:hypothetical protein [Myxococcaceae bacterium]
MTFSWTFYGQTCQQAGNVASVRITIPGESLANGGVYPCASNGYPGIVLHDFVAGTYSFTIEGLSNTGVQLYVASGTFVVNGNILVNVDLVPPGPNSSWSLLTWTFPAEQGITRPCEDRGIAYVDVQIDGGPITRYNCVDGITNPGVRSAMVAPGTHTINLWAVDVYDYAYYSLSSSLTTLQNSQSQSQYALLWAVGGTSVTWSLTNGTTSPTCAQANLNTMYVTFRNTQTGKYLYGVYNDYTTWDRIENFCANHTYLYWSFLPPGQYQVYMRAVGGQGVSTYASNFQNAPTVTITAGTFPGEAQALPITMYRE